MAVSEWPHPIVWHMRYYGILIPLKFYISQRMIASRLFEITRLWIWNCSLFMLLAVFGVFGFVGVITMYRFELYSIFWSSSEIFENFGRVSGSKNQQVSNKVYNSVEQLSGCSKRPPFFSKFNKSFASTFWNGLFGNYFWFDHIKFSDLTEKSNEVMAIPFSIC